MSNKAPPKATKTKVTKEIKSKTSTTEKLPATLFEIVPGKFNENDWNNMLDNDDSQEFIWDIIDEIVDNTDRIIYNNYLQNQIVPYTINEAKNSILHIIDWEFLKPDDDIDDDVFAEVDEEPQPTIIDSWALGYIETFLEEVEVPEMDQRENEPLNLAANQFLEELNRLVDADAESKKNSDDSPLLSDRKKESQLSNRSNGYTKLKPTPRTRQNSDIKSKQPPPPVKQHKSESNANDLYENSSSTIAKLKQIQENIKARARASETENKKIEECISKAPGACHSILKSLLSRPAGYRELEIDTEGKVVSIMKIDLDRLPNNSIKTRFDIMETTKPEAITSKVFKKKTQIIHEEPDTDDSPANKEYEDMSYYIEPASGVKFQMGKVSRVGPKKPSSLVKQQALFNKTEHLLKPVRTKSIEDSSLISRETIEKILDKQSEADNIKPLPKFQQPIPPINQSPQPPKVN